ncbi:MAG: putative ABC transporter permease [Bacteroides sp.]|nr:putative ABC transporter permease [Eubacterium sp.]MCM1419319.1 putative ABC transporter permease [Roseburia sp.]MCM1463153.1 putative ABC transporter permease [Bacteroides sp.]
MKKRDSFFFELLKQLVIFLFGGFLYGAVEILYRAHTHPSMFITGGLCLVWVGGLNSFFGRVLPLPAQMAVGSAIITTAELICGLIVNVGFGMDVWDYSDLPFNFMGQICLRFVVIWFFFSFVAIAAEDLIRARVFGEEKKRLFKRDFREIFKRD